jgi:type 1 fimbria pilin
MVRLIQKIKGRDMRKKFDIQKTALAMATCAAALGFHMVSMAQADASLSMNGQIAAPTCILGMIRMGGAYPWDTSAAQSFSFGTVDVSTLTVGAFAPNEIQLSISVRDSDGVSNCALVGNRWDIGLGVKSTDVVQTPNGLTFLRNQSTAPGAPKNIGLYIISAPTFYTRTHVNLRNIDPAFGVSLANVPSGAMPTVGSAISPFFYLGRTSASAVTPGAFSAVIPMNIFYR